MIYLVHHGIRGQKWGVKNGPPYPLGASDKSASEKRAENDGKKKTKIIKGPGISIGKRLANKILSSQGNQKSGSLMATLAVYMSFELTMTLTYLGIALYAVHKDKQKEEKEAQERFEKRKPKHLNQLPKLDKPMSPENSMKVTNPGFPEEGKTLNCCFCTTAMALREKGYDVQAQTTDHAWYSDRYFERTFGIEKQTRMNAKTPKDIVNTLESNGPGAYGNLGTTWKMGGGHSIFWKNDENGKTHIYDGQSGEEYDLADNSKLMRSLIPSQTDYCRLDNVEPTEYALGFVTPRVKEKEK